MKIKKLYLLNFGINLKILFIKKIKKTKNQFSKMLSILQAKSLLFNKN